MSFDSPNSPTLPITADNACWEELAATGNFSESYHILVIFFKVTYHSNEIEEIYLLLVIFWNVTNHSCDITYHS